MLRLTGPLHFVYAVVELVEGGDAQAVQCKARKIERNRADERSSCAQGCPRGPIGAGEDAPTTPRRAVDPGDRVLVGPDALGRQGPEFIEALERNDFDVEKRARDSARAATPPTQ